MPQEAIGTICRLSASRAGMVKDKLTRAGIGFNRILTKGLGKTNYIAINENKDGSDNPVGRAFNRRVEFKIIKCNNPNISVEPIAVPETLKPLQ